MHHRSQLTLPTDFPRVPRAPSGSLLLLLGEDLVENYLPLTQTQIHHANAALRIDPHDSTMLVVPRHPDSVADLQHGAPVTQNCSVALLAFQLGDALGVFFAVLLGVVL